MGQVRVADLPTSSNIDKDSYMIVERPGIGDGTFKSTLGDIQQAITVRASVKQVDNITIIRVKDITGEYSETIVTPSAKVIDNGDNTSTIIITDTEGQTQSTVVNKVAVDPEPTEGSNNFVTSGTIYKIVQNAEHDESRISTLERRVSSIENRMITLESNFESLKTEMLNRLSAMEETVARSLTVEQNEEIDDPFSIDGVRYDSLSEAIPVARAKGTPIRLYGNGHSEGISLPSGDDLIIDLNNYRLTITGPGAGSPGTETNGMQLLKDTNVTIKNGQLLFDDDRLKIGIQNYSNLTLDNVRVVTGSTILYAVSNNYGNIIFRNGTSITPSAGRVAFDGWYGMKPEYDGGVNITIEDSSVFINGIVEFGKANRVTYLDFKNNASITTPLGFYLDLNLLTVPCEWMDNGDGTKTLRYAGL